MLFCITANYTPKALEAMAKSPNTNRRVEFEKLLTAAAGKLVGMYATMLMVRVRLRSLMPSPLSRQQWVPLSHRPTEFKTSKWCVCSQWKK
jgi:hypothetical protein